MGELENRNCIVTGAAGSIGFASAELFLKEGAKVLLVDRDVRKLELAQKALVDFGSRVATIACDVSNTENTRRYVADAVDRWGKIDTLFINAGVSGDCKPVVDYPEQSFDDVMAVNVKAVFLACKYGIPQMNDGGSIIITSSIMGVRGVGNIVAYATSKHAVIGLMKVVAHEVAARNIRANVIAPGPVDNEFQKSIEDSLSAAIGIDATAMINGMIPLRRHARAGEIAGTALFLASSRSSFSTGAVYMADGGLSI
jgi:NAD(P)-dependent dehydrogenase (short-subunit alcohol dehydrogenase family)